LPPEWRASVDLAVFSLSGFTNDLLAVAEREEVTLVDGRELLRT
jgi:hypothetical protein